MTEAARPPHRGRWGLAASFTLALCLAAAARAEEAPVILAATKPGPIEEFCAPRAAPHFIDANPTTYQALLKQLRPGDTLRLAPGQYKRLSLEGLTGKPGACITIAGPAAGSPAVIEPELEHNTVEIRDSSYVAIVNLVIDNRAMPGPDGIKAMRATPGATHHVLLQRNRLYGVGFGQQIVGISTKTPTWDWIIRGNIIVNFGTGLYLGNSDGADPFIGGVIEGNLVIDPVGYCMEIKWQDRRPMLRGMPAGMNSTIIRRNVFIKDDRPSPDGDRPNLLVGGFPESGAGSRDLYQIYGNLLLHNPREALFQGSGRVSFHDNILADGAVAGAVFRDHDLPLRLIHAYNNTISSAKDGIRIDNEAREGQIVRGNLIFAETPLVGTTLRRGDNLTAPPDAAALFVRAPTGPLDTLDFFPLPGKVRGRALDLTAFASDLDFDRDFNGTRKGARLFRGAYAGEGRNPGWHLAAQPMPLR